MKYILTDRIALRSFWLVPYAYYVKNDSMARGLRKEEFDFLLACDGTNDIEPNELSETFLKRNMIRECADGEKLTAWQQYRNCDNRYMPQMNLQITAKCNYNCVHCFNAVDNAPLLCEMSFEDIITLLDEAQECGISSLLITGGEPMLHRNFLDIIRAIYKRDMFLFELNTNGHFLTQSILDAFNEIGCKPLMKISFDGIGFHDWMRGRKGAEQDALRAIKLCVDNDFPVMVQYNINKKNISTVQESLSMLDRMGVQSVRLIRTTPAPRWEQNAKGQTFSIAEYYDVALSIAKGYCSEDHKASVNIWQICNLNPDTKTYSLDPIRSSAASFRTTIPLCKGNRGMIAVGANGQVYPCMQMSGWFDEHAIDLGNVKRDGLKSILQSSKYMDSVCQTVGDRMEKNGKCKDCPALKVCLGGCPALGILFSEDGDILAPDRMKCYFFENRIYDRFKETLQDYKCYSEMP